MYVHTCIPSAFLGTYARICVSSDIVLILLKVFFYVVTFYNTICIHWL